MFLVFFILLGQINKVAKNNFIKVRIRNILYAVIFEYGAPPHISDWIIQVERIAVNINEFRLRKHLKQYADPRCVWRTFQNKLLPIVLESGIFNRIQVFSFPAVTILVNHKLRWTIKPFTPAFRKNKPPVCSVGRGFVHEIIIFFSCLWKLHDAIMKEWVFDFERRCSKCFNAL